MKNLGRVLGMVVIMTWLIWPVSTFGQSFERNLFYGMKRDADVARLQKFLVHRGFYHSRITGNFSRKTRDAVKKFQKVYNIVPVSGRVNRKTRKILNQLLEEASQFASQSPSSTIPIVIPISLPTEAPLVVTNGASDQTQNSAVLNGHIGPNNAETTYWFEYGLTPALENSTSHRTLQSLTGFISVTETLKDLPAAMIYYFRTAAQNAYGIAYGTTVNFVTSSSGTPPPAEPPDKLLFEEAYRARLDSFQGKISFDEAIAKFQRLIDEYPQSTLADDAQLLIVYLLFQKSDGIDQAREKLEVLKSEWGSAAPNDPRTVELSGWKFYRGCSGQFDNEALLKLPMSTIAKMEIAGSYRHRFVPANQENTTQALREYKKLIVDYPDTETAAWAQLNLFLIYGDLSDLQKQVEENEKFINDFPRHIMVPFAYERGGDLINRKFPDKSKLEQYAAQLAASFSATDYFYESSTGSNCKPMRWKKNRLMVTIDPNFSSEQKRAIQDALKLWPETLNQKMVFDFSQNLPKPSYFYQPDAADLFIEMIPSNEPTPGIGGKTVTHAETAVDGTNVIQQALIALPERLSLPKLKEVALHEMGHVLGLEHSFNRSDIMYFTSRVADLSDRDKNTIRRIYNE